MTLASKRKKIKWGAQTLTGEQNPNFKGGRYVDDKGYLRVLKSDHPFNNVGYVYEHRLVFEAHIGRFLQSWETVHHINEVKLDNRVENLYLCTPPEHSGIHREGKKRSEDHKKKLRAAAKERNKTMKRNADGSFQPRED